MTRDAEILNGVLPIPRDDTAREELLRKLRLEVFGMRGEEMVESLAHAAALQAFNDTKGIWRGLKK